MKKSAEPSLCQTMFGNTHQQTDTVSLQLENIVEHLRGKVKFFSWEMVETKPEPKKTVDMKEDCK